MDEQLYTPAEVSSLESLTPEEVRKVKGLLATFSEFSNKQKKFNEEHDHTGLNSQLLAEVDVLSATTPTQVVLKTTRAINTASGAVTYAHGLGVIPKYVHIISTYTHNGADYYAYSRSDGWSDGTANWESRLGFQTAGSTAYNRTTSACDNSFCLQNYANDSTNASTVTTATCTFDATNITLTYTKSGTATAFTDNMNILIIITT